MAPMAPRDDASESEGFTRWAPTIQHHRSSLHRNSMIRALVFDFDGLILDTETSVYEAWRTSLRGTRPGASEGPLVDENRYRRFRIRSAGRTVRAGRRGLGRGAIRRKRMALHRASIARLDQMPGVRACLEYARAKSIGTAIASSSPQLLGEWAYRTGWDWPTSSTRWSPSSTWKPGNRHPISTFAPPNSSAWTPATRSRWRIHPMASNPQRPLASSVSRCPADDANALIRSRGRRSDITGRAPSGRVDRARPRPQDPRAAPISRSVLAASIAASCSANVAGSAVGNPHT